LTIADTFAMLEKATAERESTGGNFSGVYIPFLKVAPGKTNLLFLSDMEDSDEAPKVRFYRAYPTGEIVLNGTKTYEVAYENGDPYHPVAVAQKKKDGKELNPEYFSTKGFAYVVNLTGLQAVQFYLENGKKPTKKEIKDIGELQAAKVYIDQYVEAKQRHETKREELLERDENPIEIGDYVYHGIFIYNFGATITKAIYGYIQNLREDDVDWEDISLGEYVFSLLKQGEKKNTSYSLSPSYEAEDIPDELLDTYKGFLAEQEEGLSDFENLIDRRRNKPEGSDDDLPEEYRVTNTAAAEGWTA